MTDFSVRFLPCNPIFGDEFDYSPEAAREAVLNQSCFSNIHNDSPASTSTTAAKNPSPPMLGIGLPTLRPTTGEPCVLVEGGEGVIVAGLMMDAGEPASPALMRVGGPGPGGVKTMLEIHDDHVIGDNLWLWRADHGNGVGWTTNPNETGLLDPE